MVKFEEQMSVIGRVYEALERLNKTMTPTDYENLKLVHGADNPDFDNDFLYLSKKGVLKIIGNPKKVKLTNIGKKIYESTSDIKFLLERK